MKYKRRRRHKENSEWEEGEERGMDKEHQKVSVLVEVVMKVESHHLNKLAPPKQNTYN